MTHPARYELSLRLRGQILACLSERRGQRVPVADLADFAGASERWMFDAQLDALRRELIIDQEPDGVLAYDLDEPVGLKEIAAYLRCQRDTVDKWRTRGILPEPTWPSVGGRPAWRRDLIRLWALETGHRVAQYPGWQLLLPGCSEPPPAR
jgi:hypothetical protein